MFPRIREITDPFGRRLRLAVGLHSSGALVEIVRPDQADAPRMLLDTYGAELLSGYIMASRLALPQSLAEEKAEGCFPFALRLSHEPKVAIEISGPGLARPLDIPAPLWDKLYAELCIALPHARELSRRSGALVH